MVKVKAKAKAKAANVPLPLLAKAGRETVELLLLVGGQPRNSSMPDGQAKATRVPAAPEAPERERAGTPARLPQAGTTGKPSGGSTLKVQVAGGLGRVLRPQGGQSITEANVEAESEVLH